MDSYEKPMDFGIIPHQVHLKSICYAPLDVLDDLGDDFSIPIRFVWNIVIRKKYDPALPDLGIRRREAPPAKNYISAVHD